MAASSSKQAPAAAKEEAYILSFDLPNNGTYTSRLIHGNVCLIPSRHDSVSYKNLEIQLNLVGKTQATCMVEAIPGEEYYWIRDSVQLFELKQSLCYEPPSSKKGDTTPIRLAFQFRMPAKPDESAISDFWREKLAMDHENKRHEVDKEGAKAFTVSVDQPLPASLSMRKKERILFGHQEAIIEYSLSARLVANDTVIHETGDIIQYLPPSSESDMTDESDVNIVENKMLNGNWLLPKDQQPKGFQFPFSKSKAAPPFAKFDVVLHRPGYLIMGNAYHCLLYLQNLEMSPELHGSPLPYTIRNPKIKVVVEHWFRVRCSDKPGYPTNSPAVQYGLVKKDVYDTSKQDGISITKDKDNVTTLTFGPLAMETGFSISTFNVVRTYQVKMSGLVYVHDKKICDLKRKFDLKIVPPLGAGDNEEDPPGVEEEDAPPRYSETEDNLDKTEVDKSGPSE